MNESKNLHRIRGEYNFLSNYIVAIIVAYAWLS